MNNPILFRISMLILLLSGIITFGYAQDSLKKAAVKKPIPATRPGAVPINPKTGRPYSRYGYGAYAKPYKIAHTADSIKKATPIKTPVTAVVPPLTKPVTTTAPVVVDKSLKGQYQYLLTKVYNYQKPFVDALWKNFTDTLKNNRNQLKDANVKLAQQTTAANSLQADLAAKDQLLLKTDTISLLGIALSKTTYNLIMWGLVLILAIIAGVVIAQSGGHRREAVHRTTLYNELDEELKTYKTKANEKEKKLARELQTERNKVDELMGRG